MGTIKYETCDRCNKKINYNDGRLRINITTPKRIRVISVLFGYMSEQKMELCNECSAELDKFLRG